jgi:hypothetical protein
VQEVGERFLAYLRSVFEERGETGDPSASLYLVSATEASQGWNELPLFREHLFTRRSLKQISQIKTANLQEEIRSLYRPLRSELHRLRQAESLLSELAETLSPDADWWSAGIETRIRTWLEEEIRPLLVRHPSGLRLLVGPGRWIGAAIFEWQETSKKETDPRQPRLPEDLAVSLGHRMQQLRDRAVSFALQRSLPRHIKQRIEQELEDAVRSSDIEAEWASFAATALTEYVPPSRFLFRTVQKAAYILLAALCLLALGGKEPWLLMVNAPSGSHLLQLFFSLVESVFSPSGLAALLSFGLLGGLAGLRFYTRYRRMAEERAKRYTAAMAEQLERSWQEQGERLLARLEALRGDIAQTADRLEKIVNSKA